MIWQDNDRALLRLLVYEELQREMQRQGRRHRGVHHRVPAADRTNRRQPQRVRHSMKFGVTTKRVAGTSSSRASGRWAMSG
jgi:hypothetical protein